MAIKISNNTVIDDSRNSTLNSLTFSSDTSPTFVGTGSVSGTVLTITAVTSGTIAVGDLVATNVSENSTSGYLHPFAYVVSFGTGTGGTGTYNISEPPTSTISSTTIRCGPNFKNNSITFIDTDTSVASTEGNRPVGNISWISSDTSNGAGPRAWITAKYNNIGVGAQYGAVDLVLGSGNFIENYGDPSLKISGTYGQIEFLRGYGEIIVDLGTLTGGATASLDWAVANFFKFTNAASSVAVTLANSIVGNIKHYSFILEITNGGVSPITWISGTTWAGGTAPTLTASGRDVLGFFTSDNGASWTGLLLGKDVK